MCDDSPPVTLDLPVDPQAASMARAFLAKYLCRTHGHNVADDAALLTTEAVTNAVRHGGPPIRLAVSCSESAIQIRVTDASPGEPQMRRPAGMDTSGRGVALIDVLSQQWGVEHHSEDGKDVWFILTPS